MTCQEKCEKARRMRSRETYGLVTPEELAQYPARQEEFTLPTQAGPVHIYRLTPETLPADCPMIVHFHGGGFIKGRLNKDRLFCSRMAVTFQCLVWDVDYSLAPENVFPQAVQESYHVVQYVFEHAATLGVDRNRIVLVGHSAGGNLAATVCMRAGETGAFQPAALAVSFSPMDLHTDPAEKPRIEGDMPTEVARTYNAFYVDPETARDPYASPLFASTEQLAHLPETLVMTCGRDGLCFEAEEFALKLARSGVNVTLRRFVNSLHGFTLNRNGEWQEGLDLLQRFLANHLGKSMARDTV